MVDPGKIVRRWLTGSSAVTALLGTNADGSVYVGDLPPAANPQLGPFIQVTIVGGPLHVEINALAEVRVQVKVYADIGKSKVARTVARAIADVMHGANLVNFGDDGRVVSSVCDNLGQEITDPDTGWIVLLMTFSVEMIATSPAALSDFADDSQSTKSYIDSLVGHGMDDNL